MSKVAPLQAHWAPRIHGKRSHTIHCRRRLLPDVVFLLSRAGCKVRTCIVPNIKPVMAIPSDVCITTGFLCPSFPFVCLGFSWQVIKKYIFEGLAYKGVCVCFVLFLCTQGLKLTSWLHCSKPHFGVLSPPVSGLSLILGASSKLWPRRAITS